MKITTDELIISPTIKFIFSYCNISFKKMGVLPNFIIIGAMRSGTSSLYNYMIQHPNILPAYKKEIHFFDWNYEKGIEWYKLKFKEKNYLKSFLRKNNHVITGEASPSYLVHPLVPKRIFKFIPDVKLIVILRNPIDRAYSHYCLDVRNGNETLTFEQAIEQEQERTKWNYENLHKIKFDRKIIKRSFKKRGLYYNQLQNWMKVFPKEQMLILKSEDFFKNPNKILNQQVFKFLNLPKFDIKDRKIYQEGKYNPMKKETIIILSEFFKPHNKKLEYLLNHDFGWDSPL